MYNDERDYQRKQQALYGAIADSIMEMSDEEILAEARESGEDPAGIAERVRKLLLGTDREYRRQNFREAADQYRRSVAAIRSCKADLPDEADDRRAMLAALFAREPEMGSALLTAQHRQFKNLSDLDVTSLLVQLKALGALDAPSPLKEDER
jgi:hypothetical protein